MPPFADVGRRAARAASTPLGQALTEINAIRGPTPGRADGIPHKEWLHFCVLTPRATLLLNLSVGCDASDGRRSGRLIALHCRDRRWTGGMDRFAGSYVQFISGTTELQLGDCELLFRGGEYRLRARLQDAPIECDLRLRPVAAPLVGIGTPVGDGELHWVVVPRLVAAGVVRVGGEVEVMTHAPAYHDHNWGNWRWGDDFSWQWGFVLPDEPGARWSLLFSRLLDRARGRVIDTKLALWRGGELRRLFSGPEVEVLPGVAARQSALPCVVPRALSLLASSRVSEGPQSMELIAAGQGDFVRGSFDSCSFSKVVIPHETDLGHTIIHEHEGAARFRGLVGGNTLDLRGRGVFEFLSVG